MADPKRIAAVARHVTQAVEDGNRVVVVVSAMRGTTDELIRLAGEISPAPPRRELDMLITCGERITMALLAMAISRRDTPPDNLGAEIRRILQQVGLQPRAAGALPGELSGGMAQRAALAIAVAPKPRLVIADEPETGLDPVLRRAVVELLVTVCKDEAQGFSSSVITRRRCVGSPTMSSSSVGSMARQEARHEAHLQCGCASGGARRRPAQDLCAVRTLAVE